MRVWTTVHLLYYIFSGHVIDCGMMIKFAIYISDLAEQMQMPDEAGEDAHEDNEDSEGVLINVGPGDGPASTVLYNARHM
jgi:hypothetical protein